MIPDTAAGIHEFGHRRFVGGNDQYWDGLSQLQFDLLVSKGLTPQDSFLDVACGSLRAGSRLIPYLDPGRYVGVDKHIELIIYGVACEIGIDAFREKRPHFIVSDSFDFSALPQAVDFGIAQSLFSHLSARDIGLCLGNLRPHMTPGGRFFATFFEASVVRQNPDSSHSHDHFEFTRREMETLGIETGWAPQYIGEWSHPRGQMLMEYVAASD